MKKLILCVISVSFLFMLYGCQNNDPETLKKEILDRVTEVESENAFIINESITTTSYLSGDSVDSTTEERSYLFEKDPYYLYEMNRDGTEYLYMPSDNTGFYDGYLIENSQMDYDVKYVTYFQTFTSHESILLRLTKIEELLNVSDIERGDDNDYHVTLAFSDALEIERSFCLRFTYNQPLPSGKEDWDDKTIKLHIKLEDSGYDIATTFQLSTASELIEIVVEQDIQASAIDKIDVTQDPYMVLRDHSLQDPEEIDVDDHVMRSSLGGESYYKVHLEPGQYVIESHEDEAVLIGVYRDGELDTDAWLAVIDDNEHQSLITNKFIIEEADDYCLRITNDKETMFYIRKLNYQYLPKEQLTIIEEKTYEDVVAGKYDTLMYQNGQDVAVSVNISTEEDVYFYVSQPDSDIYQLMVINGSDSFDLPAGGFFYVMLDCDEIMPVTFTITDITPKA